MHVDDRRDRHVHLRQRSIRGADLDHKRRRAGPSATATTPTGRTPPSPIRCPPPRPGPPATPSSYGYDNAGQLTSVTDFNGNTITISNTADGLPELANARLHRRHHRHHLRPDRHAVGQIALANGSATLLRSAYADAPSGDIASETDTPSSARAHPPPTPTTPKAASPP